MNNKLFELNNKVVRKCVFAYLPCSIVLFAKLNSPSATTPLPPPPLCHVIYICLSVMSNPAIFVNVEKLYNNDRLKSCTK